MNYDWVPSALIGLGLSLALVTIGEFVATATIPEAAFGPVFVSNVLTGTPFVVLLVAAGYWLSQGNLSPDRYRRIASWTLVGLLFFSLFFVVIAAFAMDEWLPRINSVRWAVSIGAGAGLLVSLFEARAIDRALASERAQLRAQELARRNERLEEFTRIISHDIRNPLNVARGNLELAREAVDREDLDRVASALERTEQVVERTLALARSGKVIGETEPVNLDDLARRSWSTVETAGAELRVESNAIIEADADRVRHLLENLFRNAIEHGGADVTVRVGGLANGFYVEDDGPGIPESERDDVLDAGYSSTEEGTGFGLTIVSQIVEAHGWDIAVTEGTDDGARFDITGVDSEPPLTGGEQSQTGAVNDHHGERSVS